MSQDSDTSRREVLAGGAAIGGSVLLPDAARPAASSITQMCGLELSAAIRAKKISCAEVMTAYLDHIERVNPKVNAIVSLQPRDLLMVEAKAKDADLAA